MRGGGTRTSRGGVRALEKERGARAGEEVMRGEETGEKGKEMN